jgi:hypothetical protein
MSNFSLDAVNPNTGAVEHAVWLANYFGRHRYGVKFADGKIYPEDKVRIPEHKPVARPSLPAGHPARTLECERAIEARFQALCEEVEQAGWTGAEVAGALLALAGARLKAQAANENSGETTFRRGTKLKA